MLVGSLRGNMTMGLVLHATRLVVIQGVLPSAARPGATRLVLLAWAATEVARYPCYVWKDAPALLVLRSVVPVATFPLGVAVEAYGLYWLLADPAVGLPLKALALPPFLSNTLVGPFGYRGVARRGAKAWRGWGKGA